VSVSICELTREFTTTAWVCAGHMPAVAAVWRVKVLAETQQHCDWCSREEQAAPGYVTPTVDAVPTTGRLSTRAELEARGFVFERVAASPLESAQ